MGVQTMRVPTIFTAVDRFSGVVSKMTATTAAFGRTAEAAAMRTSRRFNSAGTTMLYTGAAIATGLGYAVNEAIKFEKAMATVSTTIDNTTPEMMRSMGEEVLDMSKRIPKSISELTDGLYDVVSAGIDAKYAMTVLNASGRLAVAGLGTTQEGVDVLTSSLNAFNMSGTESENIANMVFKAVKYGKTTVSQLAESFGSSAALIKNSNVSLAEYLATTAVLTTTGMSASRAQTQVASAVTALIKPSKSMQAILDSLGAKNIPLFIKQSGGLVKTLKLVSDRADKMGILTSKAFGRKEGFSAMLSLLGPLNQEYNKVMRDMVSGTDTLSESFNKQQRTTAAGLQRLKNYATILAIKIGDVLLPRVNAFIDRLIPAVDGITAWIKRNNWLVTALLNVTIALLVLGVVMKIGAVIFYGLSKAIAVVATLTEAYTFVTTMAALANVGFGTALWGCVVALWAFLAPILLTILAIGTLVWAVIDMVQHWNDWKDVLLLIAGPLGWVVSLLSKVDKHSSNIKNSFAFEGWFGGIKAIGGLIQDFIVGPMEGVYNILSRLFSKIPIVGEGFKDLANAMGGSGYKVASEINIGASGMKGAAAVSTFGGTMPSWDVSQKPKNLAGKNQESTQDLINSLNSQGGTLKIDLNAPAGYGMNVDDSQVSGIPVSTSSTKKPSRDN